jgi:vancomycin resistance protein YoaR
MAKRKTKSSSQKTQAAGAEVVSTEPKADRTLPRWFKWISSILGVLIGICLIVVIGYFVYEYHYTNLVYPGVTLAGHDIGGQNFQAVNGLVQSYDTELSDTGLLFHYQDHQFTLPLVSDGVALVAIDVNATTQAAFAIGRGNNAAQNAWDKLNAATTGTAVPVMYTIDRPSVLAQLQAEFATDATPAQDAEFAVDGDTVAVTASEPGSEFAWDDVLDTVETQMNQLEPVDITLNLESTDAAVTTAAAEALLPQAQAVLETSPITFTYEDQRFEVERADVATWLTFTNTNDEVSLDFDEDAVRASLAPITGEIDVPVQEGKFSLDIVDGVVKLTQFSDGADGLGVNVETVLNDLRQIVLEDHDSTIPLVVEVTHPRANPETLEDLGITELLGTGTTNFSGSPYNRILNIHKGADMLNGLLIAPGETFSLLDVLKPIDVEHGWYSELVIKGDKLEKEAGGGLCQVGSTAFRAAMLSGLPIVERRNHSWAISYYAYQGKAGVDATIYDPSPDFKFLNDTGHYILWRSRIEGNDIYFELWGTSDGRKGSFTTPTNYNYVSPGPTIETVDPNAAPGSRVCDGHAFTGVTASFDYIVEHADGTTETETFTSVYKARPQACVVGPDAATEDTTDTGTTDETTTNTDSTDTNSNTNTNTNSASNSNKNSNTNSNSNKNSGNKNKNN